METNPNSNISLFKHVIEAMNEMVCVVNENGDVIFSNSKMERVIGSKIDRKCPGKMGKKDCETCYAKISLDQGRPQNMIYELNGRVYNVAISPIRDDENNIENVLEVWTDITGEKRLRERLTAQNKLLRNDLKLARTLQQSMLPYKIKKKGNLRFDMMYHPCEDVGGDFYDIFFISSDKVVFYIADVSGHGVSAAMLTVFFSQTVRSVMNQDAGIEPDKVLSEVWERFMQMDIEEHLYITAWIGVLDTKKGELEYSNAGHIIAPLLYDGTKLETLEVSGFPICRWIPTVTFNKRKIDVPHKSRILLYTDGLSDAWRTHEVGKISSDFKSPDELARECLKLHEFKDILTTIWEMVSSDNTITNLSDDVAMLLIEHNEATEEEH